MLHNKRGELTTRQIVILIILIISFLIILFLIFRLNLGDTARKEICHNSVILKGKSLLPSAVSLDCHTEYICLSQTNKCDKIEKPDDLIIVKTKEDVYKALADKMADCWWMFGEGAIDYVDKEFAPDFYCSICNQVYFDLSVKDLFEGKDNFSQKEIYDYIVNTTIPNKKIQYDEYLYEGANLESSEDFLREIEKKQEGKAGFSNIDLNKPHLILMGAWSKTSWAAWAAAAGIVAVGTVVLVATSVVSVPVGIVVIVAGGLASTGGYLAVDYYFSGLLIKGKSGSEYLRPIITEKDSEIFKAHKCDNILTLS